MQEAGRFPASGKFMPSDARDHPGPVVAEKSVTWQKALICLSLQSFSGFGLLWYSSCFLIEQGSLQNTRQVVTMDTEKRLRMHPEAVVCSLLIILVAGCSVKKVPDNWIPGKELDCTEGYLIPSVDSGKAIIFAILTGVFVYTVVEGHRKDSDLLMASGGIPALFTTTYMIYTGVEAIQGFMEVNKCREAKEAYVEWGFGDSETRRKVEEEWRKKYE